MSPSSQVVTIEHKPDNVISADAASLMADHPRGK